LPKPGPDAERRRRRAELVAFSDSANLDLAFIERLAAPIPGYLAEARQGAEAALLGTVKALESVYDAFEDLTRRIEATFTVIPEGPDWHRESLQGRGGRARVYALRSCRQAPCMPGTNSAPSATSDGTGSTGKGLPQTLSRRRWRACQRLYTPCGATSSSS